MVVSRKNLELFRILALKWQLPLGIPFVIAGDWSGQITVYDVAKPAQLGVLDSNPEPLSQRVDHAQKATVALKKQEQEVFLEKEKAVKTEANLVSQLAAANKSLGVSGAEEKSKKGSR